MLTTTTASPHPLRAVLALGAAFWVPALVYFLDGASYFGVLGVLNVHFEQALGMTDAQAHLRTACLTGGLTLAGLLLGGVVDRLGPRRAVAWALAVGVLGRALLAGAPSLGTMRVGSLILFGMSTAWWIGLVLKQEMRGRYAIGLLLVTGVALTLGAGRRVSLSGAATWLGLALVAVSVGAVVPAVYAAAKRAVGAAPVAGLAFALLYGIMNGGQVAEGLASPLVRARWGTPGVVWMCAGIALLALVVHLVFYKEKVRVRSVFSCDGCLHVSDRPWRGACPSCGGLSIARWETPVAPEGEAPYRAAASVPAPTARSAAQHPLRDPRFLFFVFALLGVRTLMAHQWLTVPQYVLRAYPEAVGAHFEWVSGLNPLICLVGTPLVALLTRRAHVVTMMVVGTFVTAGVTLVLVPGPSLAMLLLYEVVFSVGECLWSSRFLEYVTSVAPEGRVGAYTGAAQLPWFIAKFTTGLYSGAMLAAFCPAGGVQRTGTMWAIYAAVGLTSPVALLIASRWLRSGRLGDGAVAS